MSRAVSGAGLLLDNGEVNCLPDLTHLRAHSANIQSQGALMANSSKINEVSFATFSNAIGAEVTGLDLSAPISDAAQQELLSLLDEYAVLRFRDQHLADQDQIRVLGYFGTVVGGAKLISNKAEGAGVPFGRLLFHSDHLWLPEPYLATSLYGLELIEPTEPTWFANTMRSYANLPQGMKDTIQNLTARHINDATEYRDDNPDPTVVHVARSNPVSSVRPIVRNNPRTGTPMLCVCEMMTKEVIGVPKAKSDEILRVLFEALYEESNLFEQTWKLRDLVVWDNFAAQHGRPNVTLEGNVRTMRKVNVGGRLAASNVGDAVYTNTTS